MLDIPVRALAFAPHSVDLLLSCGFDGTVHVWDLRQPFAPLCRFAGAPDGVFDCAWVPGANAALIASSIGVRFADLVASSTQLFRPECMLPGTSVSCHSLSCLWEGGSGNGRMRMLAGYASGVVALCELDVSNGSVDFQPLTGHHRDGSGAARLLSHTAAVAAAPGQEGCVSFLHLCFMFVLCLVHVVNIWMCLC